MQLELRPAGDVEVRDGRFVATSTEPWLTLGGWPRRWAGLFVEITYRLSLLDEPVRPLLRFRRCDGTTIVRIAPAPVLGAAIWIGRLPAGTSAIDVSPTNRLGAFDFRIEEMRPRRWIALVMQGLCNAPRAARGAILTRLIGWRDESDVNLAWAIGATNMADFRRWARARTRDFEPDGMDRPRGKMAPVEVVRLGARRSSICCDQTTGGPEGGSSIGQNSQRDSLLLLVGADDKLRPGALSYVAEQAMRYPRVRLFYGDVLESECSQTFRPGWNRRLEAARSFLRPPLVVRGRDGWTEPERMAFLANGDLPKNWVASLSDSEIRPLRRILIETGGASSLPLAGRGRAWGSACAQDLPKVPAAPPDAEERTRPPTPYPSPQGGAETLGVAPANPPASATIIIPTRDHPALLRRVLTSIRARTSPGTRIIIVDNASVTDEAHATLADLAKEPGVDVLPYPGAFNFSAICNAAAAQAESDVLVFLNDDTEVLSEGWLHRLTTLASQSDVGAVGAKLTYPNGRLQHIGVVAGLGECAGHFGAFDAADAPGWAERNLAIHEVSAVTGACLAVARQKFAAVGGFDAKDLPVELSDIDLCLKLAARGWRTLVDPAVHLMHEESVSRGGAMFRRLSVHARERAVFCERWRHVLRDDPFFHPALSLYSCRAALG